MDPDWRCISYIKWGFSWIFHCHVSLQEGNSTAPRTSLMDTRFHVWQWWHRAVNSRFTSWILMDQTRRTTLRHSGNMNIHNWKLSSLTDASTAWPRSPFAFSLKTLLLFIPGYISRIHATTQVFHRPQGPWSFGVLLCDLSDENKIQNLCLTVPPNELVHGRREDGIISCPLERCKYVMSKHLVQTSRTHPVACWCWD